MFPLLATLWMIFNLTRTRVKTEGSFTAEDPWNQNRPTVFTIEAYAAAAKGTMPPVRPPKRTLKPYLLGIRSEVDGVEHMLPESLAYLWRHNRVPAEALPRLLKEMEPMLRQGDFRFQYLTRALTIAQYCITVLISLMALTIAYGTTVQEGASKAAVAMAVVVPFSSAYLYLLFFRPKARRRKQMDWALAHL
jgi:hypothetical protein